MGGNWDRGLLAFLWSRWPWHVVAFRQRSRVTLEPPGDALPDLPVYLDNHS